jgi:hypothetical protein
MAITSVLRSFARLLALIVGAKLFFHFFPADVQKFLGDGSYNSVAEIDPFFAHPFYEQLAVAEEMVRVHDCFVLLELGGQADDAVLPGMA